MLDRAPISDTVRYQMCERKRAFPSESHALGEAIHLVCEGKARALRVYRCPLCHDWHLTSKGAGGRD